MRVTDITEQRVDEKPTSGVMNKLKGLAGKGLSAVGATGTGGRLQGGAEVGNKSNEIYKQLARWQGINQKNDKNMTGDDLRAFAAQQKIDLSKVKVPDGVLPKATLMDILKKTAASELTGGNVAASGSQGAAAGAGDTGGGGVTGAIGALQKATGKAGMNNTPGNATPASDEPGANVSTLKNKGGVTPNIQAMIDKLTPTERKVVAGMI